MMLPSWLSFAIFDSSSNTSSSGSAASSPRSAVVHDVADIVNKGGVKHHRSVAKPSIPKHHEDQEDIGSVSAATSPMSTYAGTPKQDLDPSTTSHQRAPPSQLPDGGGISNNAFSTPSRRRRSSVFFKLPDLDKINNLTSPGRNKPGNQNNTTPTTPPVSHRHNYNSVQNAPPRSRRLSRASFSRSPRHRRAPIVPESKVIAQAAREANPIAPVRAVVNDIVTSSLSPGHRPPASVAINEEGDDPSEEKSRPWTNRDGDAGAELTIDVGNADVASQSEDWRSTPRGGLLRGWGDAGRGRRQTTAAVAAAPEEGGQTTAAVAAAEAAPEGSGRRPRSPRALSEGHR